MAYEKIYPAQPIIATNEIIYINDTTTSAATTKLITVIPPDKFKDKIKDKLKDKF